MAGAPQVLVVRHTTNEQLLPICSPGGREQIAYLTNQDHVLNSWCLELSEVDSVMTALCCLFRFV